MTVRARLPVMLLLAGLALAAAGCSSDTPGPLGPGGSGTTWLGLAANPVADAPPDSFASAFLTARATGVTLLSYSVQWSRFETAPGHYDLAELSQLLAMARTYDMGLYVSFHVIETNQRCVPPDLLLRSFQDPFLLARLDQALDTLAAVLRDGPVVACAIGNEVDVYLGLYPGELEDFRVLYAHAITKLHRRLPGVPVGVVVTSPVGNAHARIGDDLNLYSDLAVYTYYPFVPGSDFVHRPPAALESDMAAMRMRVPGKPWALQEIGYSSAALNGSSDSLQADFVSRFRSFAAAARRSDLRFASWFLYTDLDSAAVENLLGYYGLSTPGFRAYLGNLGLRAADGTPKRSWNAWRGRR